MGVLEKVRPRYLKWLTCLSFWLRSVMDGVGWVLLRSTDMISVLSWLMSRPQAWEMLSIDVTRVFRPLGVLQMTAISSP